MDQVRAIALIIFQQRFWVLSVIAVGTIVACWHLASGDLDSRFSKRLSAISGQFNTVKGISNEAFHPNNDVTDADRAQAVIQSKSVFKVWSDLYERQQEEVLHWPDDLGPEFVKEMQGRKFLDPINQDMRSIYRELIVKRFDKLLDIVKAKKSKGTGRGGSNDRFGPAGGPGNSTDKNEEDGDYLVEWLDQGDLSERLSFDSMPTHTQIWVTQEDLWVYETLLQVIARTNEQRHATRPDNTAVRVISRLQVGSLAIDMNFPPGGLYTPQEGGAGAIPSRGGGGPPSRGPSEGREPVGREGGGSDDALVLEKRYLGPNGAPMPGASLGAEFRQLPIHMNLKMDQRYLPQLLIECANAPLPIEVKWVRVNPQKVRSFSDDRAKKATVDDNLSTVEIQGVVLIYGEPNNQILTVPGAEESLTEEDTKEESNELAAAPTASS